MKRTKRLLTSVLAMVMCLSLFPLDALAAGTPKKSGYETKASREDEIPIIKGQSSIMEPMSANPPPSGTNGATFIASDEMEGGTFTDDQNISSSGCTGKFLSPGTEIRLWPAPDDGCEFKEREVTCINNSEYSLEFEDMSQYGYNYYCYRVPGTTATDTPLKDRRPFCMQKLPYRMLRTVF